MLDWIKPGMHVMFDGEKCIVKYIQPCENHDSICRRRGCHGRLHLWFCDENEYTTTCPLSISTMSVDGYVECVSKCKSKCNDRVERMVAC